MRKVVTRALRQAGLDIGDTLEAGDGAQGLELVQAHDDIDLILSDWNMPVMDGLEFVRETRKIRPSTPIVMVTTEASAEKVQLATEAGAQGFINKPFTPDKVREKIEIALGA